MSSNTIDPTIAVDTMNAQFQAFILDPANGVAALLGKDLTIRWEGVEKAALPPNSEYWARVSHQTVQSPQASLSNFVNAPGMKRFTTYGLTFVQLFCPLSDKTVARTGKLLATICRDAFRSQAAALAVGNDSVWFRNPRIQDNITPTNDQYRLNVVAEHEYDELG